MNHENDRRHFLKTAGAALVAAAVPTAVLAQKNDARPPSGNNLKQMIVFGGVAEPNPSLPGIYSQVCFQFQMCGDIGGLNGRGFATISDPVLGYANSHIELQSGRTDINDIYVFQGTVEKSANPDLVGKAVIIKIQVLPSDNCNVTLTIENTPVAGLLLPAIQKVRDRI